MLGLVCMHFFFEEKAAAISDFMAGFQLFAANFRYVIYDAS